LGLKCWDRSCGYGGFAWHELQVHNRFIAFFHRLNCFCVVLGNERLKARFIAHDLLSQSFALILKTRFLAVEQLDGSWLDLFVRLGLLTARELLFGRGVAEFLFRACLGKQALLGLMMHWLLHLQLLTLLVLLGCLQLNNLLLEDFLQVKQRHNRRLWHLLTRLEVGHLLFILDYHCNLCKCEQRRRTLLIGGRLLDWTACDASSLKRAMHVWRS
jgi:hypothetical protein